MRQQAAKRLPVEIGIVQCIFDCLHLTISPHHTLSCNPKPADGPDEH
jgi:hypothetical protein